MITTRNNFLEESTIKDMRSYLEENITKLKPSFYTNLSWPEEIKMGSGVVCILPADKFGRSIQKSFVNMDEKYKSYNFMAQLYIWPPGSYIPWHKDGDKDLGATVYLNESWNENYGGIFLYKDEHGNINGELPDYNKIVINENDSEHHVTMIPHSCNAQRITLQVWGWAQGSSLSIKTRLGKLFNKNGVVD